MCLGHDHDHVMYLDHWGARPYLCPAPSQPLCIADRRSQQEIEEREEGRSVGAGERTDGRWDGRMVGMGTFSRRT